MSKDKKLVIQIDGLADRIEAMIASPGASYGSDDGEEPVDVKKELAKTQSALKSVEKQGKSLSKELEKTIREHEENERRSIRDNHVVDMTRDVGADLREEGESWQERRNVQTERLKSATSHKEETADLAEDVIASNDKLEKLGKETNALNEATINSLWWDKVWTYTGRAVVVIFGIMFLFLFIYLFAKGII